MNIRFFSVALLTMTAIFGGNRVKAAQEPHSVKQPLQRAFSFVNNRPQTVFPFAIARYSFDDESFLEERVELPAIAPKEEYTLVLPLTVEQIFNTIELIQIGCDTFERSLTTKEKESSCFTFTETELLCSLVREL